MIVTINGKESALSRSTTYEHVVRLAGMDPTKLLTVTYRKGLDGNTEGVLLPKGSLWVKAGMVFNVADTSGA